MRARQNARRQNRAYATAPATAPDANPSAGGARKFRGIAFPGADDMRDDFVKRPGVGENHRSRLPVDRLARRVERPNAFLRIFDFEQRTVSLPRGAREDGFD